MNELRSRRFPGPLSSEGSGTVDRSLTPVSSGGEKGSLYVVPRVQTEVGHSSGTTSPTRTSTTKVLGPLLHIDPPHTVPSPGHSRRQRFSRVIHRPSTTRLTYNVLLFCPSKNVVFGYPSNTGLHTRSQILLSDHPSGGTSLEVLRDFLYRQYTSRLD